MRNLVRGVTLAVALAGGAVQAESLADAMVAAYRHSALLDQNRAVLRAADEDVAAATARLRPVVEWVARHAESATDTGTGWRGARSTSVTLSGSLTLYDFGRSQLAIDGAKEQVLAARQGLVAVEQNVLLSAASAYFQVRQATQQVALQQSSVQVLQQERRAAQDRFDVGEITVTDVALADAQLAGTQARLAAASGQLEIAREQYRSATGRLPGSLSAPPPLPKLPASADAARAVAQRTHPVILQAQRGAAAAEIAVAAAAAERNPTLSGNASIGVARSPNQATGQYNWTDSAQVGVEMRQTVYSGGRLSSGHRKAMAGRDQARANLLNASRTVAQQVGESWANIDVARAQIRAIDQQISAAQQAYDGVREEALLGARTTLDVLDAEQALLTARADKISAESNLQLAHYQLLAAMGLLTVESLKLGIQTYDPSQYYNAVRDAPFTSSQGESLDRVLRAIGRN